MTELTRRAFLAGAASLPMVAAIGPAVAPLADNPALLDLAVRAMPPAITFGELMAAKAAMDRADIKARFDALLPLLRIEGT